MLEVNAFKIPSIVVGKTWTHMGKTEKNKNNKTHHVLCAESKTVGLSLNEFTKDKAGITLGFFFSKHNNFSKLNGNIIIPKSEIYKASRETFKNR